MMQAEGGEALLPHTQSGMVENSYDSITTTRKRRAKTTCSRPPNMDDIPWDQVRSGDLESLRVVLFSSSTSRRTRALSDLRDKIGIARPSSVTAANSDRELGFLSYQGPIYRITPVSLS